MRIDRDMALDKKWRTILISWGIFPLLLLLYPLVKINQGVDITDTGYNLGGFFYRGQVGEQWLFLSTYLANAVGGMLCKLPMGATLLGMKFYTGLLVSASALLAYAVFAKKMPPWIVFLGEAAAIGLAWCPTVILYNYLTYFFFLLAVLALYEALTAKKPFCFAAAGVALGLNVFVRFPNIAEAALILAVWHYGFLKKKKIRQICMETVLCFFGFVLGFAVMFAIVALNFGAGAYAGMLRGLFLLGSQSGGGHSLGGMLKAIAASYAKASGWMGYLAAYAVFGSVFFFLLQKIREKKKMPPGWERFYGRFMKLCRMLYLLGIAMLFWLLGRLGMYNMDYYTDSAIFQWTAVFLLLSIGFALRTLILPAYTAHEKLCAMLVLLVIAITPLGSDNHIYTNINNLFFVAPFTLYEIFRLFKDAKLENGKIKCAAAYPVKTLLVAAALLFLVQSAGFGVCYVFRDGNATKPRDTLITQNDTLRGMYTTRENAETLESLTNFCKENNLTGKEVILCGGAAMAEGIPGLSFYLKMPSAISNAWPELESYPYAAMEQEIEAIIQDAGAKPVVLASTKAAAWFFEDAKAMNGLGVDTARYDNDKKLWLLRKLLLEKEYKEAFANAAYVVYWQGEDGG